jgi:hypothetical protein
MTTNLDKALLACQLELKAVERTEYNQADNYAYVATDKMMVTCRAVLLTHGLLVRRLSLSISDNREWTVSVFRVTHVASGESSISEFEFGIHVDQEKGLDKCAAASATTAWREWLRDLLMLPRRDRNEMDDRGRAPAPLPPPRVIKGRPEDELFDWCNPAHMMTANMHFDTFNVKSPSRREFFVNRILGGCRIGELGQVIDRETARYRKHGGAR